MSDFLAFRTMITPWLLKALYILAVVVVIIAGFVTMGSDDVDQPVLAGLGLIVFGPFVARIYFELLYVIFGIHGELVTMRDESRSGA